MCILSARGRDILALLPCLWAFWKYLAGRCWKQGVALGGPSAGFFFFVELYQWFLFRICVQKLEEMLEAYNSEGPGRLLYFLFRTFQEASGWPLLEPSLGLVSLSQQDCSSALTFSPQSQHNLSCLTVFACSLFLFPSLLPPNS